MNKQKDKGINEKWVFICWELAWNEEGRLGQSLQIKKKPVLFYEYPEKRFFYSKQGLAKFKLWVWQKERSGRQIKDGLAIVGQIKEEVCIVTNLDIWVLGIEEFALNYFQIPDQLLASRILQRQIPPSIKIKMLIKNFTNIISKFPGSYGKKQNTLSLMCICLCVCFAQETVQVTPQRQIYLTTEVKIDLGSQTRTYGQESEQHLKP